MVTARAWTGTGDPALAVWAATFCATSMPKDDGPTGDGVGVAGEGVSALTRGVAST